MKLFSLALIFLSAIVSSGNCASVAVMPSQGHKLGSFKEAYLRQIEETEKFMQKELENIKSTLGESAHKDATSMIESLASEQINIPFLKAIFDAIEIGAKSVAGKDSPRQAPPLSHTQQFESLLLKNTTPSWDLKELEKNIHGYRAEIDELRLEKINPLSWETIMKELPAKINAEKENSLKVAAAIECIKYVIRILSQWSDPYQ